MEAQQQQRGQRHDADDKQHLAQPFAAELAKKAGAVGQADGVDKQHQPQIKDNLGHLQPGIQRPKRQTDK
jgi:hypothetical protein